MGSPFRLVEREGGPAETSKAWLRQQVVRMAEATASLFAHIGLNAVDEAEGVLGFDNYTVDVPCLSKADPQVQNFVARYTLARRLNHVTRVLPPTIIQEPLSRIEQMIAAAVAGWRAEDKGKGEDDNFIGILTVVAISTSTWFA